MQWNAFVDAERGNVPFPKPDFLHTFNERCLAKLEADIVPTPDENIYVVVKGNLFPLKEKTKGIISDVKQQNAGGSQFCGNIIERANLQQAIQIMEYWGMKVTVYDEVA